MRKIFLLIFIMFISIMESNAAIKISPSTIEINANTTKKDYISTAFNVSGGINETIRFKIYPVFFKYDEKGRFIELRDNGQSDSLMGKIKFYPTEFTCQKGQPQKVRLTITGLKTLQNGESRLMLFLEDVNTKEVLLSKLNGNIGGKILVKTRVGVPVYVDKGNFTKKAQLVSLNAREDNGFLNCSYKITSNGTSKVRYNGWGYITDNDNNLIKKFKVISSNLPGGQGAYLEKEQKIDLKDCILNKNQNYNLKFVLTYKDEQDKEKVLKKETSFTSNMNINQNKI